MSKRLHRTPQNSKTPPNTSPQYKPQTTDSDPWTHLVDSITDRVVAAIENRLAQLDASQTGQARPNQSTPTGDRLIPLSKWPEYHPWPSVASLRQLVFHHARYGFTACIVRAGGRILIGEAEFRAWCTTRQDLGVFRGPYSKGSGSTNKHIKRETLHQS